MTRSSNDTLARASQLLFSLGRIFVGLSGHLPFRSKNESTNAQRSRSRASPRRNSNLVDGAGNRSTSINCEAAASGGGQTSGAFGSTRNADDGYDKARIRRRYP